MTEHKFTDEEVIKAFKCCSNADRITECGACPYYRKGCLDKVHADAADLINRQKAEIERLEYTLTGVMHSVDKWLDGSELKQSEVNRAVTMREKTLQIVERLEEENEFLSSFDVDKIRAEAIKEFAERLKEKAYIPKPYGVAKVIDECAVDALVKEMTEN